MHSMKHKLGRALVALCALGVTATVAMAQDYPNKPIRLVVPFTPGGVTDTGARVVADKLGARLGQNVVVDNRPGASGNIGTQMVAAAAPDGYTLLLGFDGTLVINPHVYSKVPFDTVKDFVPVSKIGDAVLIMVVHPSVPAKTLPELVAYSKANPGGVSYGSAGTGSTPHLAGELLKIRTGANFVHVPYKGGGQSLTDVVGGQLPMLYTAVAGAYPFVQKGLIRPIAVSSAQRLASLPDVPTVAESGVKGLGDFEVVSWQAIFVPAGTPAPIVERLHKEIRTILAQPEMQEKMKGFGMEPADLTTAQIAAFQKAEVDKWAQVIKAANIKVD